MTFKIGDKVRLNRELIEAEHYHPRAYWIKSYYDKIGIVTRLHPHRRPMVFINWEDGKKACVYKSRYVAHAFDAEEIEKIPALKELI